MRLSSLLSNIIKEQYSLFDYKKPVEKKEPFIKVISDGENEYGGYSLVIKFQPEEGHCYRETFSIHNKRKIEQMRWMLETKIKTYLGRLKKRNEYVNYFKELAKKNDSIMKPFTSEICDAN
jgi:hypothetical protein